MDYLITNGYPAAAKKFAAEANIQPKMDVESIQERVDIRSAIHSGDIKTAIEKLNELNPQVAPTPFIYFFFFFFFGLSMKVAMIIPVSCTTPKCPLWEH